MEVILLERVEKLGQMGDVVTVKNGYARNFLLPNKKALRATAANQKVFDSQKKEIEASNLKAKKEADAVAQKMDGTGITLLRQAGEAGQLYGSVSSRDIAAALTEKGFKIGRNQVTMDKPIKEIGLSEVNVRLHPEVSVIVTVNTARSAEEAEMQAKSGGVVSAEEIFETKQIAAEAEEAIQDAVAEETGVEEAGGKAAEDDSGKKAEAEAAEEPAAKAKKVKAPKGVEAAPADEAAEEAPKADAKTKGKKAKKGKDK